MNLGASIWDKLSRGVCGLFLVAGIAFVVIKYVPLIHQNERMRKVTLEQEKQLQVEAAAERQLKGADHALRNDPRTIERLARERLGYAKPGETVIRFEGATTNAMPVPSQ